MKVVFVGAGPGDPDLLTVKARRILEECQICVYAGSLVSPEVVGLVPKSCELHDSAIMTLEEIEAVDLSSGRTLDRTELETLRVKQPLMPVARPPSKGAPVANIEPSPDIATDQPNRSPPSVLDAFI